MRLSQNGHTLITVFSVLAMIKLSIGAAKASGNLQQSYLYSRLEDCSMLLPISMRDIQLGQGRTSDALTSYRNPKAGSLSRTCRTGRSSWENSPAESS
jgi:hypothetical protein